MGVHKGQTLTRRRVLAPYPCKTGCGSEVMAYTSHGRLCGDCRTTARRAITKRYRERRRAQGAERPFLREQHDMSEADYLRMLAEQGGRCLGCGRTPPIAGKQLHIDHDHHCCGPKRSCDRCRRGLLCAECNMLLGLAHDDPATLITLAEYVGVRRG